MNLCGKNISKISTKYRQYLIMVLIFILALTNHAFAQVKEYAVKRSGNTTSAEKKDTTKPADSVIIPLDSLTSVAKDTTENKADSTKRTSAKSDLEERLGIRLSPDALPSVVTSEARDSAVMNMRVDDFILYGNAKVTYEDMSLTAGKINYRQAANMVSAAPLTDTIILKKDERATFTQGQEKFTYDSLLYNFKSKKAIVRNARSQYGEGYVYSQQIKRNPDQSIYGLNNVYTTCALDTPHFGIIAKKIKVVPDKVAATGPANIEIEQVPTPIFLPFGLFPITKGQTSGFMLPTYTVDNRRGLGLINGGYYLHLSDKVDLQMQSQIYSRGSWQLSSLSSYANRYKYAGAVTFTYAYIKTGEEFEQNTSISRDFQFGWEHRSDPKSRPNSSFNSFVNLGTSSFNKNTTFNANQILQNQFQSNITYSKNWANKPISLTVAARHSQNTGTRQVDVTLPEINFAIQQIKPFSSKNSVGNKWYEKIAFNYNMTALNKVSFYDSNFRYLGDSLLNKMENGMKHSIPINASYNLFRFLNMSVGANYNEYWLTRRMYRYYDNDRESLDTISSRGFYTARDYSADIAFNTRIYGLKLFKRGKLAGIRHEFRPNVSMNFAPDYANDPYNYGYRTILSDGGQPQYLSVYEGSVVGVPGGQYGSFSSRLGFGFDNNLQIKTRSSKDSTGFKKIKIIDNLSVNSGYDLAKDSFNWSNINIVLATTLFNVINMQANASFDPYLYDYAKGARVDTLAWNAGRGIGTFARGQVIFNASLRSKSKDSRNNSAAANSDEFNRLMRNGYYNDYVDFDIPWNVSLSYSLSVANQHLNEARKDTLIMSNHYLNVTGDFNITSKWKVAVTTGYNFVTKQLQMTQFEIYRDLHCWEMRLSTIPFGASRNYTFTLNVKAQVLQDLKLLRRRDFRTF